jgi:hypothetical protein
MFPAEFRAVVQQLVRGHYSAASMLNTLPMDVLELVIMHISRDPYCFSVPLRDVSMRPASRSRCDAVLQ